MIAEKLREVEGKIKVLADERDKLKSVEVSLDPDEHPIVAAKTDLYFELGNTYRENPAVVATFLSEAIAGKNISDGTRVIITEFQTDLLAGRLSGVEVEPIQVIDEDEIEEDVAPEAKEYGFGAPEATRRVTPLRTGNEGDLIVGETFFPPQVETVEEVRRARPAVRDNDIFGFKTPTTETTPKQGRPRMKAQEIEVPAEMSETTTGSSSDRLQEALERFNEAFPPAPRVDETSVIPRPGPKTIELPQTQEQTGQEVETTSAPVEEQFLKPTGVQLLETAWNTYGNADAAADALISFGAPKGIFNKISTTGQLWNLYENPTFWMKISGQAERLKKAVDLFIQQASTTEGGLSKTAGAEMKNKRDANQQKGGRAKGGLVN